MSKLRTLGALTLSLSVVCAMAAPHADDFKSTLASKVDAASKDKQTVIAGKDGWLFLVAELRHLSVGTFWGESAKAVSQSSVPTAVDPLPAILDFRDQLKKAGIDLLMVPVPEKAAIYPEEIVDGAVSSPTARLDAADAEFIGVLTKNEIKVLDLAPVFLQAKQAHPDQLLYSKEDTHWSGYGIAIASDLIAAEVKKSAWYGATPQVKFSTSTGPVSVVGDLVADVAGPKPGPETLILTSVKDDKGGAVQSSRQSPLVLLGDSHNLIYSIGEDMLAVSSGLPENLAAKIGFAADVIGVRGSGITPSRINLARRGDNLAGKKLVVWCFTARDYTEAQQGWRKVPVIKATQ